MPSDVNKPFFGRGDVVSRVDAAITDKNIYESVVTVFTTDIVSTLGSPTSLAVNIWKLGPQPGFEIRVIVMNNVVDKKELKPLPDSTQSLNWDTGTGATLLVSEVLGFLLRPAGDVTRQRCAFQFANQSQV